MFDNVKLPFLTANQQYNKGLLSKHYAIIFSLNNYILSKEYTLQKIKQKHHCPFSSLYAVLATKIISLMNTEANR